MPRSLRWCLALPVLSLTAFPPAARADEGGLSLLVLSVPKDSSSQKAAATGAFVSRGAFARNPRYQLLDLEAFLDESQESPGRAAVGRAMAALDRGTRALDALEVDPALAALNEAVVAFEQGAAYVDNIKPYTDALLRLGAAYALNAENDNARDAFRRALVLDRSATYEKLPEQAKKAFEDAARKVDEAERGAISVFTTPAGAEVYVDGTFRGPAPMVVDRLAPGPHLLRVVRPGYRSAGRTIKVSARAEETVQLALKPTLKASELEDITARIHTDVTAGQGPVLSELARFAKVDQVFVMSVQSSATDVRVSAVLVDGTGHPLQSGQRSFTGERYRQELDQWMESGFRSAQGGTTAAAQKDVSTQTTSNYSAPTGGGSGVGMGKIVMGALLFPLTALSVVLMGTFLVVSGVAFYLALGFPYWLPDSSGSIQRDFISQRENTARSISLIVGFVHPGLAVVALALAVASLAGGIALIGWGMSEKKSMDAILAGGGSDAPGPEWDGRGDGEAGERP
ncbi:MAG: PEGA domain-containing protein [Myxococcota bacterium]